MNASSEALSRINLAKERAQNAPTWDEYEAQDDLMHRQIATATDNLLLLSLFDQLNQVRRAVAWGTVVRTSVRPALYRTFNAGSGPRSSRRRRRPPLMPKASCTPATLATSTPTATSSSWTA